MTECDSWFDYREGYVYNGMISEKLLVGISGFSDLLFAIIVVALLVDVKVFIPKFKEREPKPL